MANRHPTSTRELLARARARGARIERTSRDAFRISVPGRQSFVTVRAHPTDRRVMLNTIAECRRRLGLELRK